MYVYGSLPSFPRPLRAIALFGPLRVHRVARGTGMAHSRPYTVNLSLGGVGPPWPVPRPLQPTGAKVPPSDLFSPR